MYRLIKYSALFFLFTSCVDIENRRSSYKNHRRDHFSHMRQFDPDIKSKRQQSNFEKSKKPSEILKIGTKHKRLTSNIVDYDNNYSINYDQNNIDYVDGYYDQNIDIDKSNYDGYYKIGDRYEVMGKSYQPKHYDSFEEIGIASWYGPKFHGKLTANGEIYNMHDLTAAHPTLPLPSIVRVTNLNNNLSAVIRVNDRGPFAKDRIIDLSKKSAEVLEFINQGTAKVKVELLSEKSKELQNKIRY